MELQMRQHFMVEGIAHLMPYSLSTKFDEMRATHKGVEEGPNGGHQHRQRRRRHYHYKLSEIDFFCFGR